MSKNLIAVIGGCGLLVVMCAVCAAAAYIILPNQLEQIKSQFGGLPSGLGEVPSTVPTTALQPKPGAPAQPPLPQPPPSQQGSGNLFTDALGKAKSAQKYRVEFSMVFGATQSGKYSEEAFIEMNGEVDGKNTHFVSKSGLLALLSGGGTLEIIEADGKSYIKGISLVGLTDPKVWYIQKDSSATGSVNDFSKPDFYNSFTGNAKPSDFKKVRVESVDGQSCDVYLYDFKSVQNAALTGFLGSAKDKNAFNTLDKAEINVWLCGDGYVHRFTLNYEGHDSKNPAEKGAMKMIGHIWDFGNATIRITAPQGAKPMPGQ